MVVWCTQDLRRDGSSFMWHQPCQRCKYTTSVDIKKRAIKLVIHVEPHASAVSLLKRAENSAIQAIINQSMLSESATQQTKGEDSENVLFMSLKALYHQCKLHNRHKDNVQKSQMNENCYKLREQWFRPSVLPLSLSSEMKTFSPPRGRPKIRLLSSWNSWSCLNFERILM